MQTRALPPISPLSGNGTKHVPESHPVLRRATLEPWQMPPTAQEVGNMTDRLDHIALLVRQLPDRPVTVSQQERLRIIARELLRRADG